MVLPSYYLGDMERRRQRSKELREGLGDASDKALKSMDIFSKLEEKLHGRAKDEEQTAYTRGRDAKTDERADKSLERLDRMTTLQEKLAADRAALAVTSAEDKKAAKEASDATKAASETEKLKAKEAGEIYDLVKAKKGHLIPKEKWDELFPGVPQPKAPVAGAVDPMKADKARKAKADADMADRKNEEEKNPKPKPLDRITKDQIAKYDASLESLQSIAKRAPEFDFGPASNVLNYWAQKFGVDDAGFTKIKADLANETSAMVSDISGAAVPVDEFNRLKQGLPQSDDGDTAFMQKLMSTIERLQRARKYLSGAPVSATESPAAAPPPAKILSPDQIKW